MAKNAVWVSTNDGKTHVISEMHENHLVNAYAKVVRDNSHASERLDLAEEIRTRVDADDISADAMNIMPAYAKAALDADAPAQNFVY